MTENGPAQNFTFGSLFAYTLPGIFTFFFISLYQMVDGVFIGRFVGELAISAVNLYLPVISLLVSVGTMLGTGGNAEILRLVGEGKKKEAGEAFSELMVFTLAIGAVFTVLFLIGGEPIMRLCGATAGNIEFLRPYYYLMSAFSIPILLQTELEILIIGEGKTGTAAGVILVGGLLNCVLDFVFMKVFSMGILGAAIATVIGYVSTLVYGIWFYLIAKKSAYRLAFSKPDFRRIGQICVNGSSDMVTNLTGGITALFMNHLAYRCYGEPGVSALTVVAYIRVIILSISMGFTSSVEPIFSYHYGSGNVEMRKKTYRYGMLWSLLLGAAIMVLLLLFRGFVVGVFFTPGTKFFEIAERGCLLSLPACLFVGINVFGSGLFTAFSNGLVSGLLSFARTFVFMTVCLYGLTALLGGSGMWLSWPVAELLSLVMTMLTLRKFRGRYGYA